MISYWQKKILPNIALLVQIVFLDILDILFVKLLIEKFHITFCFFPSIVIFHRLYECLSISFRYLNKSFVTSHVVICRRKHRKLFILSEAHEGHLITGYFPGVWKYGQSISGQIGHTKMPLF